MLKAFALVAVFAALSAVADETNCDQCKKDLMVKRWKMRVECLNKGGDTKSCDGAKDGPTCCHCQKHPADEHSCWYDTCEKECHWSKQCEACNANEGEQ